MGKVQEYLEKKRIEALGLPPIWIVKSSVEDGVSEPYECKTKDIKESNYRRSDENFHLKEVKAFKYILVNHKYPFEVRIDEGELSRTDEGFGSGCGDLWVWTYYCSLSKEDAQAYYEKEKKRLAEKPLKDAIKTIIDAEPANDFINDFAKKAYMDRFGNINIRHGGIYHFYTGFKVINAKTIAVYYNYGGGDMEMNDSFTIKL